MINLDPQVAAKTFLEFTRKNNETLEQFFKLYGEFQETVRTWTDPAYIVYGLAEEAMELQMATRMTKERFRGDKKQDTNEAVIKELGDVFFFWYAMGGTTSLMSITQNVEKIADRAARNVIKGDGDAR